MPLFLIQYQQAAGDNRSHHSIPLFKERMTMKFFFRDVFLVSFFCCILASVGTVHGQSTGTTGVQSSSELPAIARQPYEPGQHPAQLTGLPVISKMDDGRLRLGDIIIDKKNQSASVQGVINMQEGLVEYLACAPYGKLHESVLQLYVHPYYLHMAMLLIGLEPGNRPLEYQGAAEKPVGEPVDIWISWKDGNGKLVKHRAEELLLVRDTPMQQTPWIFTGSVFNLDRFMAQVDGSIVAVYHDPVAILDHPLSTGNDDTIFFVNKKRVPAKGTPITFTVQKISTP